MRIARPPAIDSEKPHGVHERTGEYLYRWKVTRPSCSGHRQPECSGTRTCTSWPRPATPCTIEPTNGATPSPGCRGYVDVSTRIFKDARSAQDVLDHALRPLLLGDALLVLRRDELGDQTERDELDSHDHEQHTEA